MICIRRRSLARTPRRCTLAVLLVLAVLLAACTSGGSTPAPKTTSKSTSKTPSSPIPSASVTPTPGQLAKIVFTDCTGQIAPSLPQNQAPRVSNLQFGCGHLSVPLDYTHPAGRQLQLYLVKVHYAQQAEPVGSLLVNPGGPGASGVQLAINLGLEMSPAVLSKFNLVGFDPRGVFLSDPVQCISDAQKDALSALNPDVRTAAGLALVQRADAAVATGCTKKYGSALQFFNTEATARDMDRIRQGLGESTFNYLGYSYGTRLGAEYAHLFPTRVRAMVLDGAVDPTAPELLTDERQAASLESTFNQFAADCAKASPCTQLGPARTAVTQLITRANRVPIKTSRAGDRRAATGSIVLGAVLSALYSQDQWPTLAAALLAARRGDAKGLFALADSLTGRGDDGHFSNLLDAHTTVDCNDSSTTFSPSLVQATARVWARKYPLFGLNQAAELLTCTSWQQQRHPLPPPSAISSKPILVIGTIHDPATPYAAAGALVTALKTAVLLSWNGVSHTAYPKTKCIITAVDAYLVKGTIPPAKAICPLK